MQVVQKVHRKDWQEELLAAGILGVLKGWLEPIRGSLPLLEVWSGSCLIMPPNGHACGRSEMPRLHTAPASAAKMMPLTWVHESGMLF